MLLMSDFYFKKYSSMSDDDLIEEFYSILLYCSSGSKSSFRNRFEVLCSELVERGIISVEQSGRNKKIRFVQ